MKKLLLSFLLILFTIKAFADTKIVYIDINKRDYLFLAQLKKLSHLMYTLMTLINEPSKYFFDPTH